MCSDHMQIEAWNSVAHQIDFNLEIDLVGLKKLIPSNVPILDYGCGYGRTCNILSSNGFLEIVGCDTSSAMINRGNLEHPDLSLFQNDDIRLEYPAKHFGGVVLCAVLTCVPEYKDKIKIISEANRLLRSGGILHVVEFCSNTGKTFESKSGIIMNHQKPNELRKILREFMCELKFEIIQVKTMSGRNAEAINYFGKKIHNKTLNENVRNQEI